LAKAAPLLDVAGHAVISYPLSYPLLKMRPRPHAARAAWRIAPSDRRQPLNGIRVALDEAD
jgi:hypothetical protein